jgi:excisionase family DNA binding protein
MRNLLTVAEAAERLAVKPSTIRAWLAQRRLPCVHCGRAIRVPLEAVEQFISGHTIPARTERR